MSRKSCLIRLFKTTVSCKLFTAIILSVFLGQPALTYAGVVIGGTRVVYLSNNADKSISVFSKEEKIPYLIQAWVDPFNKEDKKQSAVYRYSASITIRTFARKNITHYSHQRCVIA